MAADPHDATVDALVEYYRIGSGEHPDWEEYRAAMVADDRLVITAAARAGLRARGQRTGVAGSAGRLGLGLRLGCRRAGAVAPARLTE